jgi:hypothetical protein
MKACQKI